MALTIISFERFENTFKKEGDFYVHKEHDGAEQTLFEILVLDYTLGSRNEEIIAEVASLISDKFQDHFEQEIIGKITLSPSPMNPSEFNNIFVDFYPTTSFLELTNFSNHCAYYQLFSGKKQEYDAQQWLILVIDHEQEHAFLLHLYHEYP